ncbi:MAG: hypothetical protein RL326_209 [Pseudomonadota bacterium]|jgi:hypothetical protein
MIVHLRAAFRGVVLTMLCFAISNDVCLAIDLAGNSIPVTVWVEAKPEPVRAKGLVFSSTDSREVADATLKKIGDKLYEVSFSISRGVLQDDSVATAVVYDADGKASYANVTPALLSETRSILGSIKECPPEDTTSVALLNSPGTLQQLVDVRTERMQLIRLRISKLLDRNFLAKLKKFEQVLGLSRADELSANLPASELIDRLSRIDHAIKKFQNSKGSVKR